MREEHDNYEDYDLSGAGGDLPDTHVDFQVILSATEFDAFVLRRSLHEKKTISSAIAAKHANKYQDTRCKESKYLLTQTPYVEPKRIIKELYRPAQPTKWVDPKGFQLTTPKVAGLD